jgi:hypothetical protein
MDSRRNKSIKWTWNPIAEDDIIPEFGRKLPYIATYDYYQGVSIRVPKCTVTSGGETCDVTECSFYLFYTDTNRSGGDTVYLLCRPTGPQLDLEKQEMRYACAHTTAIRLAVLELREKIWKEQPSATSIISQGTILGHKKLKVYAERPTTLQKPNAHLTNKVR